MSSLAGLYPAPHAQGSGGGIHLPSEPACTPSGCLRGQNPGTTPPALLPLSSLWVLHKQAGLSKGQCRDGSPSNKQQLHVSNTYCIRNIVCCFTEGIQTVPEADDSPHRRGTGGLPVPGRRSPPSLSLSGPWEPPPKCPVVSPLSCPRERSEQQATCLTLSSQYTPTLRRRHP